MIGINPQPVLGCQKRDLISIQKYLKFPPSPSSPPTKGGEIFGGSFLNVRDIFSDLNVYVSKHVKIKWEWKAVEKREIDGQ